MANELYSEDEQSMRRLSAWLKERTKQLMAEHPDWSKEYAYMVATMEAWDGAGSG